MTAQLELARTVEILQAALLDDGLDEIEINVAVMRIGKGRSRYLRLGIPGWQIVPAEGCRPLASL